MALRRRWLALAAALALVGTCAALAGLVSVGSAWAASTPSVTSAKHHPSPTPTPQPTPRPSPPPSPTPSATPSPTPTPVPTAPSAPPSATPVARTAAAPSTAPVVTYAQPPPADGAAQAIAIAPTPQAAAATGAGAPPDTQNLFWWITVAVMAIPLLIVMTLLATVLTRR